MPFAYLTESGTILRKQGRLLALFKDDDRLAQIGLAKLESLLLRGQVHLSTPALKALLASGVETTFLSSRGKLLGHLSPSRSGNVSVRLRQYRLQFNPQTRLRLAQQCVRDKMEAMLNLLAKYAANYSCPILKESRQKLHESLTTVDLVTDAAQLRGVEGNATATYWSAFRSINRSTLEFCGRSRRPPRDQINALLSLGYTILTNEVRGLLESLGFDSYLGFYHEVKNHRPALALDLVEPFRHLIVDRTVLRLANLGRLKERHFSGNEADGFKLSDPGWKIFLAGYENQMLSAPSGPLFDRYSYARSWRELVHKHALQLRCEAKTWEPFNLQEKSVESSSPNVESPHE